MQNQTNTNYFSNPKEMFELEKLNPKKDSSKTTISKVLSKILDRNKTSKKKHNFCKDTISLEVRDM